MVNAYSEDLDFHIPSLTAPMSWEPLVDTSQPTGRVAGGRLYVPGEVYRLHGHSFALFINRAPRPELTPSEAIVANGMPADGPQPGDG
jgi:hypothetical protein